MTCARSETRASRLDGDRSPPLPRPPVFLFRLGAVAVTIKGLNQDVAERCAALIKPDTLVVWPYFPSGCPFRSVYYGFIKGRGKRSSIFKYVPGCEWFAKIALRHMLKCLCLSAELYCKNIFFSPDMGEKSLSLRVSLGPSPDCVPAAR